MQKIGSGKGQNDSPVEYSAAVRIVDNNNNNNLSVWCGEPPPPPSLTLCAAQKFIVTDPAAPGRGVTRNPTHRDSGERCGDRRRCRSVTCGKSSCQNPPTRPARHPPRLFADYHRLAKRPMRVVIVHARTHARICIQPLSVTSRAIRYRPPPPPPPPSFGFVPISRNFRIVIIHANYVCNVITVKKL